MLILISSPPFVIGTQTSKATPSISRLRRLHLGRTLMALAGLVSGVLEWSLVYWLKHKTQGLQGLWAMILPECPWMPLCSSFHLLHLGFWLRGVPCYTPLSSWDLPPLHYPSCPISRDWATHTLLHLYCRDFPKRLNFTSHIPPSQQSSRPSYSWSRPEAGKATPLSCSSMLVVPLTLTSMKRGGIFYTFLVSYCHLLLWVATSVLPLPLTLVSSCHFGSGLLLCFQHALALALQVQWETDTSRPCSRILRECTKCAPKGCGSFPVSS